MNVDQLIRHARDYLQDPRCIRAVLNALPRATPAILYTLPEVDVRQPGQLRFPHLGTIALETQAIDALLTMDWIAVHRAQRGGLYVNAGRGNPYDAAAQHPFPRTTLGHALAFPNAILPRFTDGDWPRPRPSDLHALLSTPSLLQDASHDTLPVAA